jgi:hypothetical protein
MGTTSPVRPLVTITVPAEHLDEFRAAVVGEIKSDAEWVLEHQAELVEADVRNRSEWDATCRADMAGASESLSDSIALLQRLSERDGDAVVSLTAGDLRFILDRMGCELTRQIAGLYKYGPALIEKSPPMLDSLRWAVEQTLPLAAEGF